MYSQPDKITVYHNGNVVGTTSVKVSGKGTISFNYPGSGTVRVVVEGDNGTAWEYNIKCS
jgi:archaellum component FlaG (FlaF/FlaG flagellin family)